MSWEKIQQKSTMWNFEEKNELEGVYMGSEFNQGPKKNSAIHTLEVEGQEVKFWGSTVLDAKLAEVKERFGDEGTTVKIIYLGKEKSRTGTEFKNFEVAVWSPTIDEEGNKIG